MSYRLCAIVFLAPVLTLAPEPSMTMKLTSTAFASCMANDRSTNLTPLGWCGYGGDPAVARMLIDHGAIVNRPPFDELAWDSTARVANIPVARELLNAGANPNWQCEDLDTAMHIAIRSHMVADPHNFVQLLMDRGGDPDIRNKQGRTVLDEAIAQVGAPIETYFPRERLGTKQMTLMVR